MRQALLACLDIFRSQELVSGPAALSGKAPLRAFKRGPLDVFRVAV